MGMAALTRKSGTFPTGGFLPDSMATFRMRSAVLAISPPSTYDSPIRPLS